MTIPFNKRKKPNTGDSYLRIATHETVTILYTAPFCFIDSGVSRKIQGVFFVLTDRKVFYNEPTKENPFPNNEHYLPEGVLCMPISDFLEFYLHYDFKQEYLETLQNPTEPR